MPASLTLSAGTLYAFLLVLTRVGGALVFVPMPGNTSSPGVARTAFAVGFTLALFTRWPAVDASSVTIATLAGWVCAEAALGIAIGVSVAIVLEAFTLAAQVLGLQAGYAYASTIDPNTQADSGVLLIFAQLAAGLLFFALGLDRNIIRLFALSLDGIPPGAYHFGLESALALIHLGGSLFSVGVRLALPIVALLIMVDVALALLGRLNSQLQLLSLAFPVKMLVALAMLSWMAVLLPQIMREFSSEAWVTVRRLMGI
ncbi:MAG TPA: flagellar biosynthetic protein FliR [Bryobacteraceae bacterium]|nr:flagellar biosynthetic protein FliR [Bryobacteraceae bacterium]